MANTKRAICGALVGSLVAASILAGELSSRERKRIEEAAAVLNEIHTVPDQGLPQDLWEKAACVVVIPSLKKAAFVVGGEYGKGLMSCRHDGDWSAPVFMELEKGSWGLQIGAQSIDLVLLVMNERGMQKLLGNKVTLGVEASIAAGPVGRDARAATDAQLNAEILAYSRAQGLFAGLNLSGGVLRPDTEDSQDLYGPDGLNIKDVLAGGTIQAPAAARPFMQALRRK
jgi:lipid-binding SYLF domain-containing protein